jgi:hypothetical protein
VQGLYKAAQEAVGAEFSLFLVVLNVACTKIHRFGQIFRAPRQH